MEVLSMSEHQQTYVKQVADHIEAIGELIMFYDPCMEANQAIIKLKEVMHWINELTMVGSKRSESSEGTKQ